MLIRLMIGTGSGSGNVAVNASDQYMFYLTEEPVLDVYGNPTYGEYKKDPETGEYLYDENGNMIPDEDTLITEKKILPCYYRTHEKWQNESLLMLKSVQVLALQTLMIIRE